MSNVVVNYAPLQLPLQYLVAEPSNNVSFAYLAILNKMLYVNVANNGIGIITRDVFTDKAVISGQMTNQHSENLARVQDANDFYVDALIYNGSPTHGLYKDVNGTFTLLASESPSFGLEGQMDALSCAGSSIESLRWDLSTPYDPLNPGTATSTISATDTTFSSGYYGLRPIAVTQPEGFVDTTTAYLVAPFTRLPQAQAIVTVKVRGSGTQQDPYRPLLNDSYPVNWGGFEFDPNSPTNVIVITGGDPNNIQAQINYLKSQGLSVYNAPQTYDDAIALYNQLKQQFPNWIAGKDNFAYQTLGYEWLEPLAVIDFYYGELIEHKTHYQQLKKVAPGELYRTLNMWKGRLEKYKANISPNAYEIHKKKLEAILKLGW